MLDKSRGLDIAEEIVFTGFLCPLLLGLPLTHWR